MSLALLATQCVIAASELHAACQTAKPRHGKQMSRGKTAAAANSGKPYPADLARDGGNFTCC